MLAITSQTACRSKWCLVLRWGFRLSLDFFARGLHTCTGFARLPLHQLGFFLLYVFCYLLFHDICYGWDSNVVTLLCVLQCTILWCQVPATHLSHLLLGGCCDLARPNEETAYLLHWRRRRTTACVGRSSVCRFLRIYFSSSAAPAAPVIFSVRCVLSCYVGYLSITVLRVIVILCTYVFILSADLSPVKAIIRWMECELCICSIQRIALF